MEFLWKNLGVSLYIACILAAILAALMLEAYLHNRRLHKISYRIHVNGTRGKSSVTRLIAAGLRAGGIKTSAKTTGTLARFIYPDGSEQPIYRMGHANIVEQIGVIKKAIRLNCDALVIECMALQPLLQSLCEIKLVKSTHGVLTNARPDHLDVMGPSESDVALALAGTMTVKGSFFTTENVYLSIFSRAAKDRDTKLNHIGRDLISTITDEEINKFSYHEFKENVALALAICEELGVPRNVAIKGMWSATPDPGAMSIYMLSLSKGQQLIFANAFAANDPLSTKTLWQELVKKYSYCKIKRLVVNCRYDRQERSSQLGEAAAKWEGIDEIILIGSGTEIFEHYFRKASNGKALNALKLIHAQDWPMERLINFFNEEAVDAQLVVGVGNIANIGLKMIEYFQANRETEHA